MRPTRRDGRGSWRPETGVRGPTPARAAQGGWRAVCKLPRDQPQAGPVCSPTHSTVTVGEAGRERGDNALGDADRIRYTGAPLSKPNRSQKQAGQSESGREAGVREGWGAGHPQDGQGPAAAGRSKTRFGPSPPCPAPGPGVPAFRAVSCWVWLILFSAFHWCLSARTVPAGPGLSV